MSRPSFFKQARGYSRTGVGFTAALLKSSLVPVRHLLRILPERGLVVDLGCGEGMLGNLLATTRPGLCWQGVDLDPERILIANRNAPPNAQYRQGDIVEQRFQKASAAIFNDVLHHHSPSGQLELLRTASGFLDQRGVLILKEVDLQDRLDRAWTSFWDRRLYPDDELHFQTVHAWIGLLQEAGFTFLETRRLRHPWPASRTLMVARKIPDKVSGSSRGPASVKVFITGASGFMGSHLIDYIRDKGVNGEWPISMS